MAGAAYSLTAQADGVVVIATLQLCKAKTLGGTGTNSIWKNEAGLGSCARRGPPLTVQPVNGAASGSYS